MSQSNAHNLGIAAFGLAMQFLESPIANFVGLIFLAWGIGKTIYHVSFMKHTTGERKRIHTRRMI